MKRNRLLLGSLVWIAINATVLVSCSDDDSNKIETTHAELNVLIFRDIKPHTNPPMISLCDL